MAQSETLHVILGAGGAAGTPLALELLAGGRRLRTVSRTGRGLPGAEAMRADLTRAEDVRSVVGDGATVYLLAGLTYDRRVWQVQWPLIMRNTVEACEARRARLLFLDNVYLYGPVDDPMTESTPIRPASAKGRIRAQLIAFLKERMAAGRLTAQIARAADFYGPYSERSSIPSLLVFQRLAAGRPALLLVRADTRHSYTYTLDVGRALRLLAEAQDAWNEVWHLPTAGPPLTGREFVEAIARELGVPARMRVVPQWFLAAAGLVNTQMREIAEMLYQNDRDYLFDSSKFERRFRISPTPYPEGIRATVEQMKRQPIREKR